MISSKFISNMRSILNNNHSRKELLDYEKEKEYYTEYEKEIIHLILEIDNDMEIFTYKDNPYEFLGKIDILEDDLRKILTEIKEVELKAKICDYLWINFKNYECSKEAYSIYIKLANDKKINSEIQFCYLVRAFGIFIDTGRKKEQLENIKQAILYYLSENINDESYKSKYLIKMFIDTKIKEFDFLIEVINKKINIFEEKEDLNLTISYYKLLEKVYCLKFNIALNRKTNDTNIINIRRKKVEYNLYYARSFNKESYSKVHFYKEAINILKLIPNTENERVTLIKEMEPYQEEISKSMKKFSYSIDISEPINNIMEEVKGKDLRFILTYYAVKIDFIKKNEIRDKFIEGINENNLALFLNKTAIDKRGKTKYILPGIMLHRDERAIIANMEEQYTQYANIYAQAYVLPILQYISKNFQVDEEVINKIIETNVFIPTNRKKSFQTGLLAGFKFDFITALNILVPQVENAIRCLAEECGDVIYRSNEEGIEELMTFNSILDLPNLNRVMEEDFIFNLKCVFTSKFGINMRNDIAHGILDDNEFDSQYAIYTWWFILKLVCIYSPWIMFREN